MIAPSPDTAEGPAGIYLHVPFCASRCPYCSFVTTAGVSGDARRRYVRALHREAVLMAANPWCRERLFASLYIGGGTPTIIGAEAIATLVADCKSFFRLSGGAEVTLEMNPNTLETGLLAGLRHAGVNRLSIGIQSLADPLLAAIGRSHSAAEARDAVRQARKAGFDNINLDLMYGLPGQRPDVWRQTLEEAMAFGPEHIAAYELTVEEGTPFAALAAAGRLRLPDEETVLDMADLTVQTLAAAGYRRYEISNYSRPGHASRHNRIYWENGSYAGLGAGAVSCFSGCRVRNFRNTAAYLAAVESGRPAFADAECLPVADRFRETVVMGLRQCAGISEQRLYRRFGILFTRYYGEIVTRLQADGLLAGDGDRFTLTGKGLPVADYVCSQLV